jgi:hypothetical protein
MLYKCEVRNHDKRPEFIFLKVSFSMKVSFSQLSLC